MARKRELRIVFSQVAQRFYAATAWKMEGDTLVITGKKTDVTDDIAYAITEYGIKCYRADDAESPINKIRNLGKKGSTP